MISFKCINGKSASINIEIVNEWFVKLSFLIEDYAPEDILYADNWTILSCFVN